MIAENLILQFQEAYNQKFGYIWGTAGIKWTQAKQTALEKNYASTKNPNYKNSAKYGSKWIGYNVSDCSGLFVWAFKKYGQKIYHGSNTIWNSYTTNKCTLKNGKRTDNKNIKPGSAVFKTKDGNRHHIALYIGNGKVIEAKSSYYGVVESSISEWDEIGELKGVEYTDMSEFLYPVLKIGNSGFDVRCLQECLVKLGYQITVDGKFGPKTEDALKKYQTRNNLNPDGIAGTKTWEAIERELGYNPFTYEKAPAETTKEIIEQKLALIVNTVAEIRALIQV